MDGIWHVSTGQCRMPAMELLEDLFLTVSAQKENAQKRCFFGAFGGVFAGLEVAEKAPGVGSSLGINALGRQEGVAL